MGPGPGLKGEGDTGVKGQTSFLGSISRQGFDFGGIFLRGSRHER